MFYDSYRFIEEAKKKGGRVLVHCIQGISRSATIVISYIMLTHKFTYDETLKFVEQRRKIVSPNLGFTVQTTIFRQRVFEGYDSLKYKPKIFSLGFISMTSKTVVARYVRNLVY